MIRALAVLCATTLFAASAATAGPTTGAAASRATATVITLRGRSPSPGPWRRVLRLKLIKLRLKSFELCAMVNQARLSPGCDAKRGSALPRGTILRLEQKPAGKGIHVRDTPGWGMVGTSLEPSLLAVLSNVVTGNRFGTVTYRVTLRDAEGTILARSKPFRVVWHR